MNTPMKLGLTVIIIALVVVGAYTLVWSDKYKEIETLEAQYEQQVQRKERLQRDVEELPKFQEEEKKLEAELMSLVQSRFTREEPELFVANYIAEIERMVVGHALTMGDYDFKIESITPRGQQMASAPAGGGEDDELEEELAAPTSDSETLQGFPTRVFDMKMTARYATLIDFLYELGNLELDRLVTINQISLAPQSTEGGFSPVLNVTIPVTAYLRQGSQ